MPKRFWRIRVLVLAVFVAGGPLAGCDDGDDKLENRNPGNNDLQVVVAFGDSITNGKHCNCTPYPARLSGLIGKTVHNAGIPGSRATSSTGRAQQLINQRRPAFMLILYGVNDIIMGGSVDGILAALNEMVAICKNNNVVPVLATYPVPITDHQVFGPGTLALNAGIRSVASSQGIRCVDLEREFGGDPSLYLSDGLHPNDAGTQIIAMAFADLY
ncbi:MAG: hypothetical protein GX634_02660 [Lentisphaerae bacterium]|nr:hypothetical protein [Lentisphaerota bacterium]